MPNNYKRTTRLLRLMVSDRPEGREEGGSQTGALHSIDARWCELSTKKEEKKTSRRKSFMMKSDRS